MGRIELQGLGKQYGEVTAVADVDLSVAEGEVIALLGPSGCGKTTTLRMIAGLEDVTTGEIAIDGELVSRPGWRRSPDRRGLGMVFQNYAVWPHMTVEQNVGYPLKLRHEPRDARTARVEEALALVGMEGLGHRLPSQLSGGQQQRVALARALVMEPRALLLDEPLSNLDAKLRERMREEILDLHRRLGLTILHVTHDQTEAMVLSDRIVVMKEGRAVQIGTPRDIYTAPRTSFVAEFIGQANLIPARISGVESTHVVAELQASAESRARPIHCRPAEGLERRTNVAGNLFARPEAISLTAPGEGDLTGEVRRLTYLGDVQELHLTVDGRDWRVRLGHAAPPPETPTVGLVLEDPVFMPE